MKILKVLTVIFVLNILFLGTEVKYVNASEDDEILIDIDLNGGSSGQFKAGDSVSMKIKLNNVKNLFAASFNYTYDASLLQIDSIDVNDEIESSSVYEPYKDTAKDGNRARYCFTFLGDSTGLNGDYDFVTINGKAKKDGIINAGADNITFQLIERQGNDMVKDSYNFKDSQGNIYKVTNAPSNTNENESKAIDNNEQNKKNSKVTVELIKKASDNSSDADNDSDSENIGSSDVETENDDGENIDKNEESIDSISEQSDESQKNNDEKNSHYINNIDIIVAAIVIAIVIIVPMIYLKNKSK